MKNIVNCLAIMVLFGATTVKAQVGIRKKASAEITAVMRKKADAVGMRPMADNALEADNGYIYSKKMDIQQSSADAIYMSRSKSVPFAVYGAIALKYNDLGTIRSEIGYPQMDEAKMKDGAYQFFDKGAIYWSPKTGAHLVRGNVLQRYMNEKYANGFLGFPADDLKITPDGKAVYCYFEGSCIYNNNKYGAFAVAGDILRKWGEERYERGFLGYPIAEAKAARLGSKSNEITQWSQEFEGGMLVANTDGSLLQLVPGMSMQNARDFPGIYATYQALGGVSSWLGYPTEKAIHGNGVWLQQFLRGYIYRKDNDAIGYTIRKGAIWNEFAKRGWEIGCGYPTDNEVLKGNTTYQVFSKGTIYYLGDVNQTLWKEGDNGQWYLDKKGKNKGAISTF
ncbi:LGFP repeat-containing protein [Mucilaginibacter psychrotolerans]|uniref:WG repeat-containing protein n=1 Tax=Mucilaginibacter psychrotolerans TaxID=1524096 RepID=A0A4Y8S988_9SPHI|nr:hypothetical protein [Mucilaginibacter psychrotolerans]TFF35548.1 hypothetical protein E2R66_18870 [Mucilaginibacter psychrotolerans]